jgi:hypothetical protein
MNWQKPAGILCPWRKNLQKMQLGFFVEFDHSVVDLGSMLFQFLPLLGGVVASILILSSRLFWPSHWPILNKVLLFPNRDNKQLQVYAIFPI